MSTTVLKPIDGARILLNRGYKATPDYTVPKHTQLGINNATVTISSTSLTNLIPIQAGTVCDDGSNILTGSVAASNSTANTTTFKPGAAVFDNTSQNLIKDDSNVQAIWTISNLAAEGTNLDATKRTGLWFYIRDTTTLNKISSVEFRLGSSSVNYYTLTIPSLAVGWNWVSTNKNVLNSLTETGTVGTPINYFAIVIVTNIATDEFIEGDVIYDLLRQWTEADTKQTFVDGFPTINESTLEVKTRSYINVLQATGFSFNAVSLVNEDSPAKASIISKIPPIDKTPTDEIIIVARERVLL